MAKDISVALTLDNKQFDRGIAQSSKDVQNFGSTSTKSLAKTAAGVAALSAAFAGLKKGLAIAADFQDLRSSLSTVFGGLEQGAAAFERVTDIASRTQFQVRDITKAFIQLKGSGIEPTEKVIMTFANAAAITTDQIGSFQAAISLLSRTTAGGLGLEELERLGDRGIPVYEILNKKLGITRLQISDVGRTAKGAAKIIKALGDGIDEQFGSALANRMDNTNQRISNFNDQLSLLADNALSDTNSGIGELLKNLTETLKGFNSNVAGIVAATDAIIGFAKAITLIFVGNKIASGTTSLIRNIGKTNKAASMSLLGFDKLKTGLMALGRAFGFISFKTAALSGVQRLLLGFGLTVAGLATGTGVVIALTAAFGGLFAILKSSLPTGPIVTDTEKLEKSLIKLNERLDSAKETLAKYQKQGDRGFLGGGTSYIEAAETKVWDLEYAIQEAEKALAKLQKTNAVPVVPPVIDPPPEALSTLEKIADAIEGMGKNFRSDKQFKVFLDDLTSLKDLATSNEEIIAYDAAIKELYETFGQELPSTIFADLKEEISDITSFDAFDAVMLQTVELLKQGKLNADEYALALKLLNESVEDLSPIFETFKDAVSDAGNALGDDLAEALIEGEGAMDAFKNSFKNVIKQVLAEAIKLLFVKQLISGLFGMAGYDVEFGSGSSIANLTKQPKLAQGGPASANTAYMVGEQGPELFVPSTNGNVIPNGAGGSSPVTNNYITNNINAMDSRSVAQVFAENSQTLLGTVEFARKQTSYGR